MRKFKALLLFLSLFAVINVGAQTTCGFDNTHQYLLRNNREYKKKLEEYETSIQKRIATKARLNDVKAELYRIPVVVHVVHRGEAVNTGSNISDAQIQSAINAMNQQFNGTLGSSVNANIEFVLASRDPNCNTTTGIVRVDGRSVSNYTDYGMIINGYVNANELAVKNLSRWPTSDYYNIWVVPEINDNGGLAGIQGFAYFPHSNNASYDGAVLLHNATGYDPNGTLGYNLKSYTSRNSVITHEMGHAFGLYHTFEGDDGNNDGIADQCPVNTSCSSQGDMVCDTDPHRRSLSNCPTGVNACTGNSINDIVKNYMDYSSDVCQDRFTSGQVARMRAAIEVYRSSLLVSHGMNAAYPVSPYTAPVAASCSPVTSGTGLAAHYAGIFNVQVGGKSFSSSSSRNDNGYSNTAGSCLNLIQLVRGATYNFSATVLGANNEQLRAWIDYNNDGIFDNTTETVHFNASIPANAPTYYPTTTGTFTIPNTATLNTVLRMRVMDDIGTISSGCHNPTYGQAEDYPVYISFGVLPVEMFEFNGQANNNIVQLKWNTLNEKQSLRFEVERSVDGLQYKKIGTVNAAGNSISLLQYNFDDRLPLLAAFYRLKIITQQSFEYSKVVNLRSSNLSQSINVLNNPITSYIDIRISHPVQKLQLRLINMHGNVIKEESLTNINDTYRWSLDHLTLPAGMYILKVLSDHQQYDVKILKQ